MSKLFKTIKAYYNLGIYTKTHLRVFVVKGAITAEEYNLITGENYA